MSEPQEAWPDLPWTAWQDTAATLQLWTQIVGKIRLAQTPWLNHSWHVPLYLSARGLTTGPIPHGGRSFEIAFDLRGPRARYHGQRRQQEAASSRAAHGCRLLRGRDGSTGRARPSRPHRRAALRDPERRSLQPGPRPCRLRCGLRPALLARAAPGPPGVPAVPHGLRRQEQPRALLLGQLRSSR